MRCRTRSRARRCRGCPPSSASRSCFWRRSSPWARGGRPFQPALARRTLPGPALAAVLSRAAALVRRLGAVMRPRLVRLTGLAARRRAAVLVVLAARVLALPIPLGNLPPARAIVLLARALAVRDGVLMLAGAVLGILALSWNVGVVVALAAAGEAALDGVEEGRLPFGAWAEGG
ncbi:MAG: exopolysaccharide biosynthesis protein [Acetobacteraceae bacterium]|nr:exopolysaccharide biosynthesis protein [Acetobacteraceae bacterium]